MLGVAKVVLGEAKVVLGVAKVVLGVAVEGVAGEGSWGAVRRGLFGVGVSSMCRLEAARLAVWVVLGVTLEGSLCGKIDGMYPGEPSTVVFLPEKIV